MVEYGLLKGIYLILKETYITLYDIEYSKTPHLVTGTILGFLIFFKVAQHQIPNAAPKLLSKKIQKSLFQAIYPLKIGT